MKKSEPTFIVINRDGLRFAYHTLFNIEEDGAVSCYIPAFDIFYSAPNKEEGSRRSRLMVESFMNFWIKKQGFRSFVLQILKLGFKTQNHEQLTQLLNRKNINAKLSSRNPNIPTGFDKSEVEETEGVLEMAM
jgi:hypothetical protein